MATADTTTLSSSMNTSRHRPVFRAANDDAASEDPEPIHPHDGPSRSNARLSSNALAPVLTGYSSQPTLIRPTSTAYPATPHLDPASLDRPRYTTLFPLNARSVASEGSSSARIGNEKSASTRTGTRRIWRAKARESPRLPRHPHVRFDCLHITSAAAANQHSQRIQGFPTTNTVSVSQPLRNIRR